MIGWACSEAGYVPQYCGGGGGDLSVQVFHYFGGFEPGGRCTIVMVVRKIVVVP